MEILQDTMQTKDTIIAQTEALDTVLAQSEDLGTVLAQTESLDTVLLQTEALDTVLAQLEDSDTVLAQTGAFKCFSGNISEKVINNAKLAKSCMTGLTSVAMEVSDFCWKENNGTVPLREHCRDGYRNRGDICWEDCNSN